MGFLFCGYILLSKYLLGKMVILFGYSYFMYLVCIVFNFKVW